MKGRSRYFSAMVLLSLAFFPLSCAVPNFFAPGGIHFSGKSKPIIISSAEEFFLQSDQLFREGRYRNALRSIRRIYQDASDPEVEEEALFRIVLILSYGDNPNRDYGESERVARAFMKSYPESKRITEVKAVLLLLQEVHRGEAEIETLKGYNAIQDEKNKRLEEDLRKIKEIDLQMEEQKKKLE